MGVEVGVIIAAITAALLCLGCVCRMHSGWPGRKLDNGSPQVVRAVDKTKAFLGRYLGRRRRHRSKWLLQELEVHKSEKALEMQEQDGTEETVGHTEPMSMSLVQVAHLPLSTKV